MKAIKKKHYIIPIIICVLALAGLVFFYLTGSLSKSDKCEYVYIDDNDNLDSIAAKLKPIAKEQALLSFKLLARHSGYSKNIRTGKYAIDPYRKIGRCTLQEADDGQSDSLDIVQGLLTLRQDGL